MRSKKKSESVKLYALIVTSLALITVALKRVTKQGSYLITYQFSGGHRDGEQRTGMYDSVPDVFIGNSGVDLPAGSYVLEGFQMIGNQIVAVYSPIEMNLTYEVMEEEDGETEENA